MSEKAAEQYARDTLNALIAGGYFPKDLLRSTGEDLNLSADALLAVELQLRKYYSTGIYDPRVVRQKELAPRR